MSLREQCYRKHLTMTDSDPNDRMDDPDDSPNAPIGEDEIPEA